VATADEERVGTIFIDPSWAFVERTGVFNVVVSDQVTDGCWATTDRSKTKASLQLVRSDYEVKQDESDQSLFAPTVTLTAVGYGVSDYSCAVSVLAEVTTIGSRSLTAENQTMGALYRYTLWSSSSLLTGSKSDMSDRIASEHEQLVERFLVALATNANDARSEVVKTAPDAQKEVWRKYME